MFKEQLLTYLQRRQKTEAQCKESCLAIYREDTTN